MSNVRRGRIALLLTLLIPMAASCIHDAEVHPRTLPLGAWGGTDISLTATNDGATMLYSCGSAKVNPPLSLDGEGNFAWTGTSKQVGGAAPGVSGPDVPTNFTGEASLSRIVLRVTPVDQPQNERVFTLLRGSPGTVYGCP